MLIGFDKNCICDREGKRMSPNFLAKRDDGIIWKRKAWGKRLKSC